MLAGLENCYEVGPGRCGKVLGIDEPPPLRVKAERSGWKHTLHCASVPWAVKATGTVIRSQGMPESIFSASKLSALS